MYGLLKDHVSLQDPCLFKREYAADLQANKGGNKRLSTVLFALNKPARF